MIKRISIIFFLIVFGFVVAAQKQPDTYFVELVYKMVFQPDSTDNKKSEEQMSLFLNEEQSVFCSTNYITMDSAIIAELEKGNRMGPSLGFLNSFGTKNGLIIFKTPEEIITYDKIAQYIFEPYFYKEKKDKLEWSITKDTMNLQGLPCQKAELFYGNRKWVAWFAPSIPISEGPYKFWGLPGLIVNIYDIQKYWSFSLIGLNPTNKRINIKFQGKTPVPIKDKHTFFTKKIFFRDNRLQMMEQRGWKFPDRAKSEIFEKDRAKKDNNWIELYSK